MEHREEELIQQLLAQDDELKALYFEHQELKQKLEAFRHKLYLTPEQELEKKRIQKLKLASKDRLMEVLHRHRSAAAH
jgi:formyltetrahydrofolate synthetase